MTVAQLSQSVVYGLSRCPHCGVSTPLFTKEQKCILHFAEQGYQAKERWYFTATCSRCNNQVLFYGNCPLSGEKEPNELEISRFFPTLTTVDSDLPPMASKFLQQALESKHAPDGALMLASSSIDAMLKDKGFSDGSLFSRIEKATMDGTLTKGMAAWAHEIRLSANEPRHADENYSGATPAEAAQIIEFATALGEYLYALPARVNKWQEKAVAAKQ